MTGVMARIVAASMLALTVSASMAPAVAATDYIAPGSPATVGQGGAILGSVPDHPVAAQRGTMSTFGLPEKQSQPLTKWSRLNRADVQKRLEEAGYSRVVDLIQDPDGVWRATARKANRTVTIRCDGSGTITEG